MPAPEETKNTEAPGTQKAPGKRCDKSPAATFGCGVASGGSSTQGTVSLSSPRPEAVSAGARLCSHTVPCLPAHLLGLVDEVIRLVPVSQEVCGLLVVHPDVVIGEQARKEVVYFPGHIQNVVNAVEKES